MVTVPCAQGAIVGACDGDQKCTLAVPGQGLSGGSTCGPAGSQVAWSPCASDAECADGLWCEASSGVCKPWCSDASLCPDGAACVVARRTEGTAVPGWRVCTAHCRLDNPGARCGTGVNCVLRDIDDEGTVRPEGDCAASEGKTAGCICQTSSDCAPGLRCDSNGLQCRAWCDAGGTCAGGSACGSTLTTYPPPPSTSTGGTTGEGGATSTSSTASSGGAAPECLPPAQGCGSNEKCTLVDEAAGLPTGLGCVEAGPRTAFEPCDADAVCGAGLWCDYTTAVCKPLCDVAGLSCSAGACAVGRDSAGLPISGLRLCLANCQPVASNDKPRSDDAAVTCFYRADEEAFDCGQGQEQPWPSSCTGHLDCAYGLGCIQNQCRDWCPNIGSECFGTKEDGSWYCEKFSPCGTCTASGLTYEGAPLGVCL